MCPVITENSASLPGGDSCPNLPGTVGQGLVLVNSTARGVYYTPCTTVQQSCSARPRMHSTLLRLSFSKGAEGGEERVPKNTRTQRKSTSTPRAQATAVS